MSINNQFKREPEMVWPKPTTLSLHNVRLEPLSKDHLDDLIVAVKDGKLYNSLVYQYTRTKRYECRNK